MIIDHKNLVASLPYDAIIEYAYPALFYVATDIIINPLGFGFKKGRNHPFTNAMVAYKQNKALNAKHSPMYAFYHHYQPKTLHEAFLGYSSNNASVLNASPKMYHVPWMKAIPMGGIGHHLDETHGSHFLGPVSDALVNNEFKRLSRIFNSIARDGFDVEKQTDTIRGYFLRQGDQHRFIIVGGNHRVGVLSAMESSHIPVMLHLERPRVVDREDLLNSDDLQRFHTDEALALFDQLFSMRTAK